MKDHEMAAFTNKLRDVANSHAGCQSMREAISGVVHRHLDDFIEKLKYLEEKYEGN